MEIILNYLFDNYPQIAGYALILFIFGFVVYKISTFYSKTCKIPETLGRIDSTVKNIESFITKLCGAIQSGGDLRSIDLYKTGSPLNLTPKGYEAITQIGFKADIDENEQRLFAILDSHKPNSAFDVEQLSIGIIRLHVGGNDENLFKRAENFIYNNPTYNDSAYFKAAGIYLRDKYLKIHSGLLPK